MELFLLPLLVLGALFATLDGGSDEPDDSAHNDTLEGGGNDTVAGGTGEDDLTLHDSATGFAGTGDDTLNAHDDAIGYGRDGEDSLTADGNATVMGGNGNDVVDVSGGAKGQGGAGDDTLTLVEDSRGQGDDGNDTIFALGHSLANGNDGNDRLYGSDTALLWGGDGDDIISISDRATTYGGAGNDTFLVSDIFYAGSNLTGGSESDRFLADFGSLDGVPGEATLGITDFESGVDQVGVLLGDRSAEGLQVRIMETQSPDPGEFSGTHIEISSIEAGKNSIFSHIYLTGVTNFDTADLVFFGKDLTDQIDLPVTDANDTLTGAGNDTVSGGAGNDLLTLEDESTGFGGEGDDTLNASDNATGYGREGDDSLTATGNAVVMGGDGNDVLAVSGTGAAHGGADDDLLTVSGDAQGFGATGNDSIHASDNAVVNGGDGNDVLEAEGNASVAGGAGNDDIRLDAQFELEGGLPVGLGEGGNDVLYANVGTADGGLGDDTLGGQGFTAHPNYAGLGTTLAGGAGNDLLVGYLNVDLRGGDGDDRLVLGAGSDADGGAGNDTIMIAPSDYVDDTDASVSVANVAGGTGADRFVIASNSIHEVSAGPEIVISDFAKGEDRLQVELLDSGNFVTGRLDRFEISEDPAGGYTDVTFFYQNNDDAGAPVETETQVRLVGVVGLDATDIDFVSQVGTQFVADWIIEPVLGSVVVHNTGTAGADKLTGQTDVWVETGGGDDLVRTDATGDVVADLGDGDDRFVGNGASAFVFGGAGDDLINVRSISAPDTGMQTMEGGTDGRLDGGAGNDTLIAGDAAADLALYGGDGDDVLSLNMGQMADGGAGADHYTVSVTPETIAEGYMANISWEPGDSIAMDIAGSVDGEVTLVHGHWDNGEPTGISTVLVGGVPVLTISHPENQLPSL